MKKVLTTSILVVSLFFCLFTEVKADTITINMTSAQFDLLTPLPTMLETIANSNYSTHRYSIIAYRRYSSDPWEYIFAHSSSGAQPELYWLTSWNELAYYPPNQKNCFSADYTSIGSCIHFTQNLPTWNGSSGLLNPDSIMLLIYNSPDAYLNSGSPSVPNIYNYVYNDKTFEFDANTMAQPTIYSLNEYFTAPPPTPPDNTPTLTSFYTLCLEKISLLCNYFAENIYLLAIPIIPLFLLIIYLIKRSMIK